MSPCDLDEKVSLDAIEPFSLCYAVIDAYRRFVHEIGARLQPSGACEGGPSGVKPWAAAITASMNTSYSWSCGSIMWFSFSSTTPTAPPSIAKHSYALPM
jgi:hypothetical protein